MTFFPWLIICDESVNALEVSIQTQVINLLKELQNEFNLSLIFIAHDLSVVKHISDRIMVMYLGKLWNLEPIMMFVTIQVIPILKPC